jgi:hypothetical protein
VRYKLFASIVAILLVSVFYADIVYQANSQLQSFQSSQIYAWSHPTVQVTNPNSSGQANIGVGVTLTVVLGHPHDFSANQAWMAQQKALGHDWVPDCLTFCFNGVKYAEDPTVHVVNGGIDCIGFLLHGTAHGTTCSTQGTVLYLMVSASSAHAPVFTDTSCTATVAITNGFSIALGTYSAGTPSAGSSTDTITYTWMGATGATSNLDLACLSWTNTNAANTLFAMGQIGATTVNIGDTLQTLWSITYSSS